MVSTAVLTAEWTKIRSVRSTIWTLLLTVVISVGLGVLVALSFRSAYTNLPEAREHLDPFFATFYSLTLGQLALVVFGVLVVGGEYGSGTIRASLMAVPRRDRFYACKVLAGTLLALGVSVVTVFVTFFAAQAALGPHRIELGGDGVPQAIAGACLYLTLICLFAMGLAAVLRSTAKTLGILLPLLLLGSQGLGNIPKVKTVAQYLPDQAGMLIMHLAAPSTDPRFGRDYGPWTGLGILVLWTAAALVGGYLVLRRRDA
jgi:ABC-type transport system involved in multi-copper enzyme maturation permease subunit